MLAALQRLTVVILALLASSRAFAMPPLLPPAMVAIRDTQHGDGSFAVELAPLGSAFATWDGERFGASVGGGLLLAAIMRGSWPDWRSSSEWAIEARVRVLSGGVDTPTPDIEVPIDLLVRWGSVSYDHHLDTSGWPTEVFEPRPVVPYVGIGITLDVSTLHAVARLGPLVVLGLRWWLIQHFGLIAELEVRALFGDTRAIGQLGGSLGLVVGF